MELEWTTILFEIVNFVVLLLLLTKFLFKPVRRVLTERRQLISSALDEARGARDEGAKLRHDYEARKQTIENEAIELRNEARQEGESQARELVERTRAEMLAAKASQAEEHERAVQQAIDRLGPELGRLAIGAARRVIQDMGAPEVAVAYARQGAQRLAAELGTALTGARVHVGVSEDANLYDVSLVLRERLGEADIDIDVDPTIVGGVRLRAPGVEVEASAGAAVEAWLEAASMEPVR